MLRGVSAASAAALLRGVSWPSAAALLRGVYFTSGTQEGSPIDRLIGAMALLFCQLALVP